MDKERLIREMGEAIRKVYAWYLAADAEQRGQKVTANIDVLWADAMTAVVFADADYAAYKQEV